MLKKKQIIFTGAILIALILTVPRLLVHLSKVELTSSYGLSFQNFLINATLIFGLVWVVLNFNLKWKKKWFSFHIVNDFVTDVIINLGLLGVAMAILTFFKGLLVLSDMDNKWFFILNFSIYVETLSLILLLSWLVVSFEQAQQNLLEKEQAKQQALNHQLAALRNQINPHFLFNNLNSLHSLVLKKSDKAAPFVENLSWLLSQTLQRSKEEYISLKEELEYLEAYIFLQKERFGEKLIIDISIPDHWQKEIIPSFSLQLLVENAIKHNIVSSQQPLKVKIYTKDQYLIVKNPIQKRRDAVTSIGTGLSNLSKRYKLLKKENLKIENDLSNFVVKLRLL